MGNDRLRGAVQAARLADLQNGFNLKGRRAETVSGDRSGGSFQRVFDGRSLHNKNPTEPGQVGFLYETSGTFEEMLVPGPESKNSCYRFAGACLWNFARADTTRNTTGRGCLPERASESLLANEAYCSRPSSTYCVEKPCFGHGRGRVRTRNRRAQRSF